MLMLSRLQEQMHKQEEGEDWELLLSHRKWVRGEFDLGIFHL